ncbi:MAG: glycosyltransferase family 4 protein, partial [bacterium]|nr:glycosyltransferase family 4 protein [bacterium]
GRLSPEKGLFTLLDAVEGLDLKLKIIGTGPLEAELKNRVKSGSLRNVRFLGYQTGKKLHQEIKRSMFLVLPSECYENNPLSVLEAFALGKPAVGARIGGIPELVINGKTGYTFQHGNSSDLREKILKLSRSSGLIRKFGINAHKMVRKEYNSDLYYQRLLIVYKDVIHESRS